MRAMLILSLFASALLFSSCDEDDENVTGPGGAGAILGRVFDIDNLPIADATIVTDPVTQTVQSNGSGIFRINDMPVGAYIVTISKTGYAPATYPIGLDDGEVYSLFASLVSTSPDTATVVATVSTGGGTVGIAARGATVFASGEAGLQVYDLTDPNNSILLGQVAIQSSFIGDVELYDNAAYVGGGGPYLQVVEITDLGAPVLVGEVPVGGQVHDIELDDQLMVCAANDSVVVLDATNPLAPSRLGAVATLLDGLGQGSFGAALDVTRDLAIISGFNNGVDIVDYSNPAAPEVIGHLGTKINPYDASLDTAAERAFVMGSGGFLIFSYASPNNPQVIEESFGDGRSGRDVAVVGNLALNATGFNGLSVLDISNPEDVRTRQRISSVGNPCNIALVGHRAYVAADNRLLVVDVAETRP